MALAMSGCVSYVAAEDLANRYHLAAVTTERQAPDPAAKVNVRPCRKAALAAMHAARAAQEVLAASGASASQAKGQESAQAQADMLKACQGLQPAPPGSRAADIEDSVLDALDVIGGGP